jgi:hypothetical protein
MYGGVQGQGEASISGRPWRDERYPFGLDELIGLLGGVGSVSRTMQRIAEYCVDGFPHIDGAAVRIMGDAAITVAAGVPSARIADELHDELLEGPAVDAFAEGDVVWCGSLGGSAEWPRFGPRVGRLGLHSALSFPLLLPATPVGVVTVYSQRKQAFFAGDADIARYYAPSIAAVLHTACVHERERRRVSQLTQALEVRPQIDRAVGIMMSRTAKSPEQALNSLRQISNTRHVKVATLADEVVDEAVRRARQRRTVRSDKQESSPSSYGV